MQVHTIRLRAPWKWEKKGDTCVWSRVFGRPTNLSERETVWLVLQSESARAGVNLNRVELGEAPGRFDVTAMLRSRNKIVLEVEQSGEADVGDQELPFDAALEIVSG